MVKVKVRRAKFTRVLAEMACVRELKMSRRVDKRHKVLHNSIFSYKPPNSSTWYSSLSEAFIAVNEGFMLSLIISSMIEGKACT